MIQKFREDHPVATTVAGTGLVIAGGAVLGPAMVIGSLNAVGFTSSGIAAGLSHRFSSSKPTSLFSPPGSVATGIQSAFYGGAASGLFSICQSVGATAVAPSLGAALSGFGGLLAGARLISGSQSETRQGGEDEMSQGDEDEMSQDGEDETSQGGEDDSDGDSFFTTVSQ